MSLIVNGFPKGFSVPSSPPLHFIPAGEIASVWEMPGNPHRNCRETKTGAQMAGLRYEKKIKKKLEAIYGQNAVFAPWLSFTSVGSARRRCCSPDVVIALGDGLYVIVEIKIRHVADSYWQLRHLYHPVMQKVYPSADIRLATIVGSFDPATYYPEEIDYIYDLSEVNERIGVLRWK